MLNQRPSPVLPVISFRGLLYKYGVLCLVKLWASQGHDNGALNLSDVVFHCMNKVSSSLQCVGQVHDLVGGPLEHVDDRDKRRPYHPGWCG
jgi:hypothetical protein